MHINDLKNFDVVKISNGIELNTYFVYQSKNKIKLFNLDYPDYKKRPLALDPDCFKHSDIEYLGNLWDQITTNVTDEQFKLNTTITESLIGYMFTNFKNNN